MDSKFNAENELLGLDYLEGFTIPLVNAQKTAPFEWRRQIKSSSGNKRFKIQYYGELHPIYKTLIVATEFAPQKIVLLDVESIEEILLFDSCKYGYNALLYDLYSTRQVESRSTNQIYQDQWGNDTFELVILAYYQIDYEEEFRAEVDHQGKIELINGQKIPFGTFKRNACDGIQIWAINKDGQQFEILSEELA